MDEVFLGNAIQHLDKALLNTALMSDSFSGPEELSLAATLVDVLLEFLKGESRDSILLNMPISYLKQRDQPPRPPRATSPPLLRLSIAS